MSNVVKAVLPIAGTIFGGPIGGLLGASVGGMGGNKSPDVKPPALMPTVNDASVQEAKRRKIMGMQSQAGRASTIFTGQDDEKIGG